MRWIALIFNGADNTEFERSLRRKLGGTLKIHGRLVVTATNYPGSQCATCVDLSTLPDNIVYDLLLMRILPRTEDGVKEELLKPSEKFPIFVDILSHDNIEEWYEHLVAYSHSINKA